MMKENEKDEVHVFREMETKAVNATATFEEVKAVMKTVRPLMTNCIHNTCTRHTHTRAELTVN